MPTAAKLLAGKQLNDGWKVVERIERDRLTDTGGFFSESYIIENNSGKRAFLKAVDFSSALGATDPAKMLEAVTRAFNFERSVLEVSRNKRLDRIVTPIGEGSTIVPEADGPNVTQYLIFELADGDLRKHIRNLDSLDAAWILRALHHVASAIEQLHQAEIAHQDLKPSNVLVFQKATSKVADLGRCYTPALPAPHDNVVVAGDLGYAPPELLYRDVHPDYLVRRFGCDAYLMGSMIAFMFTGTAMTPLIFHFLKPDYRPRSWGDAYADVLPHVRDAFGLAIDVCSQRIPTRFRDRLIEALKQLCDPDPLVRGHPKTRSQKGNPYSLTRYVSLFNLLATEAQIRSSPGAN